MAADVEEVVLVSSDEEDADTNANKSNAATAKVRPQIFRSIDVLQFKVVRF